jgi:protein-disulfide isomerase
MKTRVLSLITVVTCLCAFGQEPPQSRNDIEVIVREFILQHPEVLMESMRSYQVRQRAEHQQQAKKVIAARTADLLDDASSPAAGKASGKTPVVMFFDYRCGYCKRMDAAILELSAQDSAAYVIFKELPILGPESEMAASAALAAAKQDAYVRFHQALMTAADPVSMPMVEQMGLKLGLDVEKLKTDMQSAEISEMLARNQQLAEALGVRATPSFVIGSELISGGMEPSRLQALVAKARTSQQAKN